MRCVLIFVMLLLLCVAAGCATRPNAPERSGSVGRTDNGCLMGGARLTPSDDLLVLNPDCSWGTQELVDLIEAVAHEMRQAYPDAPPLVVGDLSREGGGRLAPHASHQSGRDADVAMYALDNRPHRRFVDMTRGELDVPKTWSLIQTFLEKGHVQYVLLDTAVQKIIYDEISLFVPERQLAEIFQYPRQRRAREAIIRHAAGHRDHIHVRIHCPRDDAYCVE
jgi:murein endopeptidase